ncbi:MAG: hypothetical protein Edafosvirus2_95 [Edafosvirus sp.]|uniref:Uncharacterized protein n=1 Tax=Edafosvirus sp. TaxID=2487765 RepID=A0A3G4ZSN7_9VIRU|nr:MAG: hypothetical protein Edafosvirus2_95 [Edafosvirus sp.]
MSTIQYVDCYNCNGANTKYNCGVASFGCTLCKYYGDNNGKLLKIYNNLTLIIPEDGNNYKFQPPDYKCIYCKDSLKAKYPLFDENINKTSLAHISPDENNPFNFWPYVEISCHICLKDDHKNEKMYETIKYNNINKNIEPEPLIEYVDCYNCTKLNKKFINDKLHLGCVLCTKYGNGLGKLQKKYGRETVTITYYDKNITFSPPFNCEYCGDTMKSKYQWNNKIIEIACHLCSTKRHKKEYQEIRNYSRFPKFPY